VISSCVGVACDIEREPLLRTVIQEIWSMQ